ncbi:MAG TPA: hypothetical protein VGH37_15700 [Candidatus Acidoferrum sp.]
MRLVRIHLQAEFGFPPSPNPDPRPLVPQPPEPRLPPDRRDPKMPPPDPDQDLPGIPEPADAIWPHLPITHLSRNCHRAFYCARGSSPAFDGLLLRFAVI